MSSATVARSMTSSPTTRRRRPRRRPRRTRCAPVPTSTAAAPGIPPHPVRLLDGVRAAAAARGVTVRYAPGARLVETTPGAIAAAVAAARDADAVIAFVGLDPRLEGEEHGTRFNPGGDRL